MTTRDADQHPVGMTVSSFNSVSLDRPLMREAREAGLSEADYLVLSVLCIRNRLTHDQLSAFLLQTGCAPSNETLSDLERRGYLTIDQAAGNFLSITESGRRTYIRLLMFDKLLEERALADFRREELVKLTGYLRRIVASTDPGVPDIWSDGFS